MKRIGMLTSGGDCQALNATMRGVVKAQDADDKSDDKPQEKKFPVRCFAIDQAVTG